MIPANISYVTVALVRLLQPLNVLSRPPLLKCILFRSILRHGKVNEHTCKHTMGRASVRRTLLRNVC
jgi:hypothetical protein